MKSILFLLLAIILLPSIAEAQKDLIESCQPVSPPVIDGIVDEWPMEWLSDSKGKYIYNICNDNENLYVRLKISDPMTQRKIGLFGLTLFLNPKGKKIGKMGIKYPIEKDLEEEQKQTPTGQLTPAEQEELKRRLVRDVEVLELVGFSKEHIVSPRLGLMNGIQVFILADSRGDYVYEAKLPFKAFNINKSSVKVLGVAFVSGKMPLPKATPTNNAPPPGGGYGGGYGGGGYGGGYGRGYGRPINSSAPQYTEWNSPTSLAVGVTLNK